MDQAPETPKIISRETLANKALYALFGLNIDTIASPETAPKILDFNRFWRTSGFQYVGIPKGREVFIGADFDSGSGKIEVTEAVVGTSTEVDNEFDHLINFHTEPSDKYNSQSITLRENTPDPYHNDVKDFLLKPEVQCEIIMRLISKKEAGVVLLLKTQKHKKNDLPLRATTHSPIFSGRKLQDVLRNDLTLMHFNQVAVYRGFITMPPVENSSYLRLRSPKKILAIIE